MRRLTLTSCLTLPLLLAGCPADEAATPEESDAQSGTSNDTGDADDDDSNASDSMSTSGSDSDSDPTSPATSGTSEAADSSSSGEPEPEFVPYPARGIFLDRIVANQGVEVPIVTDGLWVDGSGRNATMVQNRNTMVRAFWQLDPDFEPRELLAQLTMIQTDGTEELATRRFTPTGPSDPVDIDSTVYFVLPAELVTPGVQFQVELFETTYDHESDPEPATVAYPAEPGFLGIEGTAMKLRAVLVPIQHNLGAECPEAPELTDEVVQYFNDQLFMQNPVQEVELVVHDTVTYSNSMQSFGSVLSFLADLRAQDNADPAYYYYGLVRPCDGGPDGVGGQAISIPSFPDQGNAWTRTAVGRFYASPGTTAGTFVHEIGHTQGRRHVACSGEEGGADPSYPYSGGDLGVWGFGNLDFSLYSPTTGKDYMTYCGNTWVSDWGWNRVVPFIQEITSWEGAGAVPEAEGRVLVGLIEPKTGDETWFVTPGRDVGRVVHDSEMVEFIGDDGVATYLPASIGPMGDNDAYNVVVELTDQLDIARTTAVTRLKGDIRKSVASIRVSEATFELAQSAD